MKPLCECCGEREADETINGYADGHYRGEGLRGAWFSVQCCTGGDEAISSMNDRIRARRAARGTSAEAPRTYGTQPKLLPETLPPGTVAIIHDERYVLEGAATLGPPSTGGPGEKETYHGKWTRGRGEPWTGLHASWIQWASVPSTAQASPANEAPAPRMYGTRPAVLPESLPAGVVYGDASGPNRFTLLKPSRHLRNGDYQHVRTRRLDGLEQEGSSGVGPNVHCIDWSTVPVQEASCAQAAAPVPETSASTACENCRAPKHDPKFRFCAYCMNDDADKKAINDEELQLRNVAARSRMDAVDRRAKPRITADARECAKPHPWPEFE